MFEMTNIERINEAKRQLNTLNALLEMIENKNLSVSDAGRKIGLTAQQFSREIDRTFSTYLKEYLLTIDTEDIQNLIATLEKPSEKLLNRIFNKEGKKVSYPAYDEAEFWSTVKSYITDKEYDILTKIYGYDTDKVTLQEIGDQYGCTRARVNNIHQSIIYKLSNISIFNKIFFKDELAKIEEIENHRAELENTYTNIYNKCLQMDSSVNSEICDLPIYKNISTTNLKRRTKNALNKAGYTYIKDLSKVTDFSNIKGLGRDGIKDIITTLSTECGDDDQWLKIKDVLVNTHGNNHFGYKNLD